MQTIKKNWIKGVILLPSIYILTLMWWIPNGSEYLLGLVAVVFVITEIARLKKQIELPPRSSELKYLTASLWLFVLYCTFIYLTNGDSWSQLKAMLAMAIYGLVFRCVLSDKKWLYFLILASASGLTILSWTLFFMGEKRVGGFINPVPYATAVATLLMTTFIIAKLETEKHFKYAFGIVALFLFTALILTKTRGVIAPTIVILILTYFLISLPSKGWKKTLLGATTTVFIIITSLAFIAPDRINRTSAEISTIAEGNYHTSIGLRLIMWDAAIEIWKMAPLFGVGDTHLNKLNQLLDEQKVHQQFAQWKPSHYHNQYLNILAKKGLLGLLFFSLILVAAFRVAFHSKQPLPRITILSILAVYLTSSLSNVPFKQPETIGLFFVLISLISTISFRDSNSLKDKLEE